VAALVRAYADIAQHLNEVGYSDADAARLQKEVESYSEIRSAIKKHSGEELDIKPYEADMRHLLNTYGRPCVAAPDPRPAGCHGAALPGEAGSRGYRHQRK